VGADNLCHQAIFVNDASGAIAPPEAEVVQVGDAIGQRAKRRGLVQGPVQQLTPATSDPAGFQNCAVLCELRCYGPGGDACLSSLTSPGKNIRPTYEESAGAGTLPRYRGLVTAMAEVTDRVRRLSGSRRTPLRAAVDHLPCSCDALPLVV
jgi:hypothetical protein